MVNLRRLAFWGAGVLLGAVILALLIWPEMAGTVTMVLLLLAAVLGVIGLRDRRKNARKH